MQYANGNINRAAFQQQILLSREVADLCHFFRRNLQCVP